MGEGEYGKGKVVIMEWMGVCLGIRRDVANRMQTPRSHGIAISATIQHSHFK